MDNVIKHSFTSKDYLFIRNRDLITKVENIYTKVFPTGNRESLILDDMGTWTKQTEEGDSHGYYLTMHINQAYPGKQSSDALRKFYDGFANIFKNRTGMSHDFLINASVISDIRPLTIYVLLNSNPVF